jgi:alkanesulfonate monooxygenase SsuD/methylene tetrahydromethanopterin reductase-like flavin-dependent oxidoreductase (luciferase family)
MSACEVSWFSALCDDDYEFLGVADPRLQSSWDHCRDIAQAAEAGGYDNLLLPSGYTLGIDSVAFAAAIAPLLRRMQLLLAVRMGEMWPPQLARQLATIDQILGGRLTVNIISSDLPGETLDSDPRYRRTLEIMHVLRALLDGERVDFHGDFVDLTLDPPRLRPAGGCPPLYFGGLSDNAKEVAAQAADVFLMWPDTLDGIAQTIADVRERARCHHRTLRFGYRAHVIVRDTEAEARGAPRACSQSFRPTPASRSAAARWTPPRGETRGRPSCATPPATTATSSPTCGPGSAARGQGRGPRSSGTPIRSCPSCGPTASSAWRPSSSRAIRTSPRATCSPATCCPVLRTVRCRAAARPGPRRR